MRAYKVIIAVLSTVLLLLSIFSFKFIQEYVKKDYLEVSSDIIYHSSEELYGQVAYLSRLLERFKEGRTSEIRLLYEGYKSATGRKNLYNIMKPYIYNNFEDIYSEEIYKELDGLLEEIDELIYRISEYVLEAEAEELDNGELTEEINSLLWHITRSEASYGRTNYDLSIESILIWPYQVNSHNEDEAIWHAILDFKATLQNINNIIDTH